MAVKLTLSIDERLVKKAKTIAKERHTSVSKLFEQQIENLVEKQKSNTFEAAKLIGVFGKPSKNLNWKKDKLQRLTAKYDS